MKVGRKGLTFQRWKRSSSLWLNRSLFTSIDMMWANQMVELLVSHENGEEGNKKNERRKEKKRKLRPFLH